MINGTSCIACWETYSSSCLLRCALVHKWWILKIHQKNAPKFRINHQIWVWFLAYNREHVHACYYNIQSFITTSHKPIVHLIKKNSKHKKRSKIQGKCPIWIRFSAFERQNVPHYAPTLRYSPPAPKHRQSSTTWRVTNCAIVVHIKKKRTNTHTKHITLNLQISQFFQRNPFSHINGRFSDSKSAEK